MLCKNDKFANWNSFETFACVWFFPRHTKTKRVKIHSIIIIIYVYCVNGNCIQPIAKYFAWKRGMRMIISRKYNSFKNPLEFNRTIFSLYLNFISACCNLATFKFKWFYEYSQNGINNINKINDNDNFILDSLVCRFFGCCRKFKPPN